MYVVGYLHHKGIKLSSQDVRKPGDPVPEATHWRQNVLQAHLNLKWLQTVEEYNAAKASIEAQQAHRNLKALPKAPINETEGSLSKADLVAQAKQMGVAIRGSKQEIARRIRERMTGGMAIETSISGD